MDKQFHLTHSWDSYRYCHSGSGWTLEKLAMKGYTIFPQTSWLDPHHEWFSIISRTLIGVGGLTPLQRCSRRILESQPSEHFFLSKFRIDWTDKNMILEYDVIKALKCQMNKNIPEKKRKPFFQILIASVVIDFNAMSIGGYFMPKG